MQRRCGIVKTKGELAGRVPERNPFSSYPSSSTFAPFEDTRTAARKISVENPGVVNHSHSRKFAYCIKMLEEILFQQKILLILFWVTYLSRYIEQFFILFSKIFLFQRYSESYFYNHIFISKIFGKIFVSLTISALEKNVEVIFHQKLTY